MPIVLDSFRFTGMRHQPILLRNAVEQVCGVVAVYQWPLAMTPTGFLRVERSSSGLVSVRIKSARLPSAIIPNDSLPG